MRVHPGGVTMEAQRLLDAAPFAPEVVKNLKRAFEAAWATVAATTAQDRIDDTRMALAHAIIARAGTGGHDVDALMASAYARFEGIHLGRAPARRLGGRDADK